MDLNDLLAEVDGIGADEYVPSATAQSLTATAPPPAPASRPDDAPVMPAEPEPAGLSIAQVLGETPAAPAPRFGSLDMVLDVELDVLVELGQARLPLKQLMSIQAGDQLALEQHPDDPVKVFVNDRLVALGEPLIVDGSLAVRIVSLTTGEER